MTTTQPPADARGPDQRAADLASRSAALHDDPRFRELRARLLRFVIPASAGFLGWYLLYVLMSAYARGFMSTKVIGDANVALVFGLMQFVTTFGIAMLYSRHAGRRLDPVADRLREELEGERA